jgi:hypothetical protein
MERFSRRAPWAAFVFTCIELAATGKWRPSVTDRVKRAQSHSVNE